jgi:hypothetical protein
MIAVLLSGPGQLAIVIAVEVMILAAFPLGDLLKRRAQARELDAFISSAAASGRSSTGGSR